MEDIKNHRVAILAANGFEESELFTPLEALRKAGAEVTIVSLDSKDIRSWNKTNWGKSLAVDTTLKDCSPNDFDALFIPGGLMSPDTLRANEDAVDFVAAFGNSGKVIGSICHGPWMLIEAGLAENRELTSYTSIRTDLLNAGALWVNKDCVVDEGIVTSRGPEDLAIFCERFIGEIAEGNHLRQAPSPDQSYSSHLLQ